MFGPAASSIRDTKYSNTCAKQEDRVRGAVISNARIKDYHFLLPKCMIGIAIILGITYFANLIFAKLLSKEDLILLEKISGTFFRIQLLLILGILSDDPDLIVAIISKNAYTKKYISEYLAKADMLRSKLEGSNRDLLRDILTTKSIFGQSFDLQMSYRKIYTMLEN